MAQDQKPEVPGDVADRGKRMNKVWTSDDLRNFRTELLATRDLWEVAKVLDRPVTEVEEMARDLGWIESPPTAPK